MRASLLGFAAGIAAFQLLPALPPWQWLLPAVPVLIIMWRVRQRRWLAFVLLGLLWAVLRANMILTAPALESSLYGKTLQVRGYVTSLPERNANRLRFHFDIVDARLGDTVVPSPGRVRLTWYRPYPGNIRAGQGLDLAVRLKPPRGFSNPGGFDYERWLFSQGIRATGYVKGGGYVAESKEWDKGTLVPILQLPNRIRQFLRQRFHETVHNHDALSGVALALAIGDRSGISQAQWQVLRITGTSHLVAISGLHIGLVAGLVFLLARWLWSRSARLTQVLAAPRAAALASLLAALLYAALAGFAIPTQRALVMVSVTMAGIMFTHRLMPSHILCLALAGVLLLDPFSVLSAGFWLSFWAVAVILYVFTGRVKKSGKMRMMLGIHAWVAIGLTPLLMVFFQQLSLCAPLANGVVVPWISWVSVPLVLVGSGVMVLDPETGGWIIDLAVKSLELAWYWLDFLAQLPLAQISVGAPLAWTWLPATLALVWLLGPRGLPGRWLALPLMLPLFLAQPARPAYGEFSLNLLDVGQGLATVIMTRDHVLVFDTGPRFSTSFNAGSAVIVPFLRYHHRNRVDALMLSHGDLDHVGGKAGVLAAMPVTRILAAPALATGAEQICGPAGSWQWDGVSFRILYPFDNQPNVSRSRENNHSCVIKISTENGESALLTGDIEVEAERLLLKKYKDELQSQVLVVPHHGSTTSSSADFVRQVDPVFALVPAGFRNRYGFPKAEIVQRYAAQGSTLLSTGNTGAISFLFAAGKGLNPRLHRQVDNRYWRQTSDDKGTLLNYEVLD